MASAEDVSLEQFRAAYRSDKAAGRRVLLPQYQLSFPGQWAAIAREFLRLESEATPAEEGSLGMTVGPYRILGLLGRGGQADVFLAEDTRLSSRRPRR